MPDFRIGDAEFDRQATILGTLVETIEISSKQDGIAKHHIAGSELPIIPRGGQNTMAAAAVVLLAAHLEEYIRQQVEEYAKGIILEYDHLETDFKGKLIDTYWRSGSGKLARIRPRSDPFWTSTAEPLLQTLIAYPVGGDATHFLAAVICEHENNMRWGTVAELTGRVGVKNLASLLYKSAELRSNLGHPSKGDLGKRFSKN
jgi:hypothetical protein